MKRSVWKKKPYVWARNPKPKKPMSQKSAKQTARDREYSKVRKAWLAKNEWCQFCKLLCEFTRGATEVHHARGRAGALLTDTGFFVASCRTHRDWPHENPSKARELGLLSGPNEWNVSVKHEQTEGHQGT
jgi:hypothetical protein